MNQELIELPSFPTSSCDNSSPGDSRCLKSDDRLNELPSLVKMHLSIKSHCVAASLVRTLPEKCFPVISTIPGVGVKFPSLDGIVEDCLCVGAQATKGKTG
jgi:hypothetical protein